MKSTGEVLGLSDTFEKALLKGLVAAGYKMKKKGGVLITVRDTDKPEAMEIADRFVSLGFDLYATAGTANKLNREMIPGFLGAQDARGASQYRGSAGKRQDRLHLIHRHPRPGSPSG